MLTTRPAVHCRWMIRRDLPEVLAIEHATYGEHAWSEEKFIEILRCATAIGRVFEVNETVAGFMIHEHRRDCLEFVALVIAEQYRRRGIASQAVQLMVAKLRPGCRTRLVYDLHESNLAGQLFLRSRGFRAVKVLRGIGSDGADFYRMEYRIAPNTEDSRDAGTGSKTRSADQDRG